MIEFYEFIILYSYFFIFGSLFFLLLTHIYEEIKNNNYYTLVIDSINESNNNFNYKKLIDNKVSDTIINTVGDSIIVAYVDDTPTSEVLLKVLNSMFPSNQKIAVNLLVPKSNDIIIYLNCLKYNFTYFNNYNDNINMSYSNILDEMSLFCQNINTSYCFMLKTNDCIINEIFNRIYTNNFKDNIETFKQSSYNNVMFYNIFYNTHLVDINNYIDTQYCGGDNINNKNIITDYIALQDSKYENWRNNLINFYKTQYFNNNEINFKEIFDYNIYKYGCIMNIIDNYLPLWLFNDFIRSISCELGSLDLTDKEIEKLYNDVSIEDNYFDYLLMNGWRVNYNNNILILYNVIELQNKIDECEPSVSIKNIYTSVEDFLNGNILYKIICNIDDNNVIYNHLDMNLENTNNESIFNNFVFKNFGNNIICSNN